MDRRQLLQTGVTAAIPSMIGLPPLWNGIERRRFRAARADARRRQLFPDMHLVTHEGATVRLYDDLVKGKTVVFHFMYTTCTRSCPVSTANVGRVRDLLHPRVGRDVFIYSITVDPAHDTPARLREYAARVGASPGWLFLTGKESDILTLRRRFGDTPAGTSGGSNHLGLLSFGVEPLERWAACPARLNAKWIVRYLSWLDPHGERPNGRWPDGHVLP